MPIISKIERKYLMLALVTALATPMIITSYQIYAQPFSSPVAASPEIKVDYNPQAIAVNPTTNKIYVVNSNFKSNSVSVISGATDTVLAGNITLPKYPTAITVNPTTNMIYIANYESNSVSVIDPYNVSKHTEGSIAANIPVGEALTAIAVNPTTNMIYIANSGSNSVSVIDVQLTQC